MRSDLPSGTVTFLFTDVEGSTKLLRELGAEAYAEALAEHRLLIREACAAEGGVEIDTQGDAFFFAFPSAPGALASASALTEALAPGPIQVRVGLHTGAPLVTDEGYVGDDVHFAARVASAGHGGQVILSAATASLVDAHFTDLGEHRLKDIERAVAIFQLGEERFPPLKTISNTNLPRPASSFVGRERELSEVLSTFGRGTRLLTLTGPGGSGKTRLAVEVAAALVPSYKAGVFWVGLASVREPSLVGETIAQTLGARDGLAAHIADREMLLLLDNLEQVIEAAPALSGLVQACPNLTLCCTSRELLRVHGEVEYPVPPLASSEAVTLFHERSGLEPSSEITELCHRLDDLPLAVELAAARTKALSPGQILERLSDRLDLLRGGRDADARQQTLRATIAWSYDLLPDDEQRVLRALSVFEGGCTLEAAEKVAGADLDTLQSLVEKSLLRFTDERFWLLETIRAFASERLEELEPGDELRRGWAEYYRDLAHRLDDDLRSGVPEEGPVADLEREIHNLRGAVGFGLAAGDVELVRTITVALPQYWLSRGLYGEERLWLERALALSETEDDTRRRLLSSLGLVAYVQRDFEVAKASSERAASLAAELGGATSRLDLLGQQGRAAIMAGDFEAANRLFRERLTLAVEVDNGVAISSCRLNLAAIANLEGRHDAADDLLAENLPFTRSRGQVTCETHTLAGQAEILGRYRGRPEDGGEEALRASELAVALNDRPMAAYCLDLVALSAVARGDLRLGSTLLAATEAARERMGYEADEDEEAIRAPALELLGADIAASDTWMQGRVLDLPEALELAKDGWPTASPLG